VAVWFDRHGMSPPASNYTGTALGQHSSDWSRDLATSTFDLGGHDVCGWCGLSSSIRILSLKFVSLAIRKIWRTMCVSINRSGDADLWPFALETGMRVASKVGNLPSTLLTRYVCDGRTDVQKQRLLPLPYGGGDIITKTLFYFYSNSSRQQKISKADKNCFTELWQRISWNCAFRFSLSKDEMKQVLAYLPRILQKGGYVGAPLSPSQCPYPTNVVCSPRALYRTYDGRCNNLLKPLWGSSHHPLGRFLQPDYADGKHRTLSYNAAVINFKRQNTHVMQKVIIIRNSSIDKVDERYGKIPITA